ncbi:MAG TPA: heavy metal translocating P-type ATPase [Elusimicrobiota bacterium]|nr:heavy metal translocating P-type ATPase [Elusimicrobiota bacterium]
MSKSRPSREASVAGLAAAAIALHLIARFALGAGEAAARAPLVAAVALGGVPLLAGVLRRLRERETGADLLAAIGIAASAAMGEWLVAAILVLMLSGGGALERFAAARASSALAALAKRMPRIAHRRGPDGTLDVDPADLVPGDVVVVYPHEACPVDGTVLEGHGRMDESYLTGEPFQIAKAPGSAALSGAINGETALVLAATRRATDSRYAAIMRVLEHAERDRPRIRRMSDKLAAWYVPLTLLLALAAGLLSRDANRFLAVLVVATPCPLILAVPVAVIGAVSLAASRGIVVRVPAVLERIARCRTVILDKTGTLTLGRPALTELSAAPGTDGSEALRLAAALEQYSRHPLARAILAAAREAKIPPAAAAEISEKPGEGLRGTVDGRSVRIVGRAAAGALGLSLPPQRPGLECFVLADGALAATLRFHDAPHPHSRPFLSHLSPAHGVRRIVLLSGDREAEARYLAEQVGISEVAAGKTPEEKVAFVRAETARGETLFAGDGINDAPALLAAGVGVALGTNSDVTTEAAGAVILAPDIGKLDELIHIGRRMRAIALQSAVGGMLASAVGMLAAACGLLPPLEGAILQEAIDLVAILNALRAAFPPRPLSDF